MSSPTCLAHRSRLAKLGSGIQDMYHYYVYILTSKKNGTLYIGITNNLLRRTYQHKTKIIKGFTKEYKVNKLVYFESYDSPKEAILREKQLKKWNRSWKIDLIESKNFYWKDLSVNLLPGFPLPACRQARRGNDIKQNYDQLF